MRWASDYRCWSSPHSPSRSRSSCGNGRRVQEMRVSAAHTKPGTQPARFSLAVFEPGAGPGSGQRSAQRRLGVTPMLR
jgi:hypothetical protein